MDADQMDAEQVSAGGMGAGEVSAGGMGAERTGAGMATRTESFAALAERIRASPPRLGPVRLVAVDGPSGAGKTIFAGRLAAATGAATGAAAGAVPVVHTDDLLDGWEDQFTFWARLERCVLQPLRAGQSGRYERYLWHRRRFGGVPVTVPPAPVVLLEGVSAARTAIRAELSLSVFVDAPADLRLRRAARRHVDTPGAEAVDRVALRSYLERWRVAEDRHFAEDGTAGHVDLLVDGAAEEPQDGGGRYVRLIREHERA